MAEARVKRDTAKALLRGGVDAALQKQVDKQTRAFAAATTFKLIVEEWLERLRTEGKAEITIIRERRSLHHAYRDIGGRPMTDLSAPDLLAVMRKVETRGALYSAHRLRSTMSRLFRYTIATGRATRDLAADLRGALPAVTTTHRAAIIDPNEIGLS